MGGSEIILLIGENTASAMIFTEEMPMDMKSQWVTIDVIRQVMLVSIRRTIKITPTNNSRISQISDLNSPTNNSRRQKHSRSKSRNPRKPLTKNKNRSDLRIHRN